MKAKKPNYDRPDTIIGNDTIIEGSNLRAKNSIQINGKFSGDINVAGSFVVGEQGTIEGNVQADFMLIAGIHQGNIKVNHQIHILSTGKVFGDIECSSIIIDDGALFEGSCKMNGSKMSEKEKK